MTGQQAAASYNFYHPMKEPQVWGDDFDQCETTVRILHESGRNLLEDKKLSLRHCMEAKGYVFDAPTLPPGASFERYPSNSELFPEYSILDSVWHAPELAEKRAKYLRGTGLSDTSVSAVDLGENGIWYRVLIGSAESRDELHALLAVVRQENGLQHARVIRLR